MRAGIRVEFPEIAPDIPQWFLIAPRKWFAAQADMIDNNP
jgi:hypothetical protein